MLQRRSIPFVVLTALFLGGCSMFGGKAAEEPAYAVIERDGDVELRQYDGFAVARTFVPDSYDAMTGEAFGRLFDYITGDNSARGDIAMTAPVLTAEAGEEIAMTAPVLSEAGADGWWMAFVLPDGMTASSAPVPTNPAVEVVDVPARQVAALTYSGSRDEEANAMQAAILRDWIENRGLDAAPGYQAAGYNPPWTLPFLRRNEVLIELR